nr:DUF3095 family protein [uncultured Psychroserpens sp.]
MKVNNAFYHNLIKHNMNLQHLLEDENLFTEVPTNWYVVVADVENSTLAVENGLHDEVNLAATGSIVAVLNELKLKKRRFKIPYFFGGDGATFIVPSSMRKYVMEILQVHRLHVENSLSLNLRIGSMPVQKINDSGFKLKIAKLKLNPLLTIPIILGNGLNFAENELKQLFTPSKITFKKRDINLEGMECRWNEIKPKEHEKKVVCLLVNSNDEFKQAKIYAEVIQKINSIFGSLDERQPVSTINLSLNSTFSKLKKEMYAKIGKYSFTYLIKNWFFTNLGKVYFKFFEDGKEYLLKLRQLTDTIMIDGNINTVMLGNDTQIKDLESFLITMENKGDLTFGMHTTYASVMSCYVHDRKENHIHFVDATEGGYTTAAIAFKQKSLL